MARVVGRIAEVWRYPVKSMAGERLSIAELGSHGVIGDRLWAVRDETKGQITSGKRLAGLMMCEARYVLPFDSASRGAGDVHQVQITLPSGNSVRSDEARVGQDLSQVLEREVTLWPLQPADARDHYRTSSGADPDELRTTFGVPPGEPLPDLSRFPIELLIELSRYATPRGTYFDAFPLHIVTTASLAALRACDASLDADVRRFRPNLLIDTSHEIEPAFVEQTWCGGSLHVGEAEIRVEIPTVRCVMPARAQPDVPACPGMTKAIAAHADRHLGVYARVVRPSRIKVGDSVVFEESVRPAVSGWLEQRSRTLKRLVLRAAEKGLDSRKQRSK